MPTDDSSPPRPNDAPESRPTGARTEAPQSAHVLLVEDDAHCLRGLTRTLTRAGFEVSSARDGGEALKVLQREPVDIVVTDLLMPGMDGIDLLLHMKSDHPEVPVLAITGVRSTNRLVRGARLYGARVLEKPFDDETLTRAVSGALAR